MFQLPGLNFGHQFCFYCVTIKISHEQQVGDWERNEGNPSGVSETVEGMGSESDGSTQPSPPNNTHRFGSSQKV